MKKAFLKNSIVIICLFAAILTIGTALFLPDQIRIFSYGIKWSPFLFFVAGLLLAFIGIREIGNENRGIQLP